MADTGQNISNNNLSLLVRRLTDLVRSETNALRDNPMSQIAEFVDAKNRCLYEINLVLMDRRLQVPPEGLLTEFARLRAVLDENARVLEACKGATQEIVRLMSAQQHETTTDGTYSHRSARAMSGT